MDAADLRIGLGHDTHRLIPGGPLILGGIEIPHDAHCDGHSDADVLLHAITDALLGAAGLGDIGDWFPNTSEANRNRDSSEMLALAHDQVMASGLSVINLDCIVFAERPKLAAHKDLMRKHIAHILGLAAEQVSIKAKTGEAVGPVGQQLAIQAQCAALLFRSRSGPA